MNKFIKTIRESISVEHEERKSRFLGIMHPVDEEQKAIELINQRKSEYWDARHNVYAYCICKENVFQKYSDDGEPGGTAGLPILNVIKHSGLQNVCIIVTRYFGGILLGVGGLARAYGKSASLLVDSADVYVKKLCRITIMEFDYKYLDRVKNLIESKGYEIRDTEYAGAIKMTCFVPTEQVEYLKEEVLGVTNGNIVFNMGKELIV